MHYIDIYVCTYVCMYVCLYVCMYVWMGGCIYDIAMHCPGAVLNKWHVHTPPHGPMGNEAQRIALPHVLLSANGEALCYCCLRVAEMLYGPQGLALVRHVKRSWHLNGNSLI